MNSTSSLISCSVATNLIARVQTLDDGEECEGVLLGVDDQLELWVTQLGDEHVHAGPLLKSPTVFVLKLITMKNFVIGHDVTTRQVMLDDGTFWQSVHQVAKRISQDCLIY